MGVEDYTKLDLGGEPPEGLRSGEEGDGAVGYVLSILGEERTRLPFGTKRLRKQVPNLNTIHYVNLDLGEKVRCFEIDAMRVLKDVNDNKDQSVEAFAVFEEFGYVGRGRLGRGNVPSYSPASVKRRDLRKFSEVLLERLAGSKLGVLCEDVQNKKWIFNKDGERYESWSMRLVEPLDDRPGVSLVMIEDADGEYGFWLRVEDTLSGTFQERIAEEKRKKREDRIAGAMEMLAEEVFEGIFESGAGLGIVRADRDRPVGVPMAVRGLGLEEEEEVGTVLELMKERFDDGECDVEIGDEIYGFVSKEGGFAVNLAKESGRRDYYVNYFVLPEKAREIVEKRRAVVEPFVDEAWDRAFEEKGIDYTNQRVVEILDYLLTGELLVAHGYGRHELLELVNLRERELVKEGLKARMAREE